MKKLREYDLFTRMLRTRPLMLAALLYLLGCILGYVLNPTWILSAAALSLLLLTAFLLRGRFSRIAAAILAISMMPLGALCFNCSWNFVAPLEDRQNVVLSGRICEIPQWNAETERSICVLENLQMNGTAYRGKLRLYLRGNSDLLQQTQIGQEITCTAHIWKAKEATNPGQFNFSNALRLKGLRGYATAEIGNANLSIGRIHLSDRVKLLKAAIGKRIEQLFPENTAVAKAFLIGEKSDLSSEDREAYSKTGAAHLLAISGMHISILAGLISALLGKLFSRKHAFLLTLALLIAYGVLIGFSASLLRAVLMFALFGAAPLTGRHSESPTRLAAAMFISLFVRPYAILDSSFVLSYGATAGIIFLYRPLLRLIHAEEFVDENTMVGFYAKSYKCYLAKILSSLTITAAAQLAILPAVVHFFGAQPIWSFIVNLVAAPLAMMGYIVSIFATLLNFAPLAAVADFIFGMLTRFVSIFSRFPMVSLRIARFPAWLTLLCVIALFLSGDFCKLNRRMRSFLPLFVLLAIPISNLCAHTTTLDCSIVFLDAGQADCAVIRSEGKVYLVDTGDAYSPVSDYLSAMNYNLDGIFLSHCHTDHAGGLDEILNICTPKVIYISENWNQFEIDENVSAALQTAVSRGSSLKMLSAGDEIRLSEKTLLHVLSPMAGFSTNSANEDSLVLHLSYGNCSTVIGGDAPTSVCLDRIGDIDLWKVNHHGASDALNARLACELSPSVSVISVGYNHYGHPADKTIAMLEATGSRVYRTDKSGAITCRLKSDGEIRVQVYQSSEDNDGLE